MINTHGGKSASLSGVILNHLFIISVNAQISLKIKNCKCRMYAHHAVTIYIVTEVNSNADIHTRMNQAEFWMKMVNKENLSRETFAYYSNVTSLIFDHQLRLPSG